MTARAALLMFVIGSPFCFLALAALGHAGSAWSRRVTLRVVDDPREPAPAAPEPDAVPAVELAAAVAAVAAAPPVRHPARPARAVRTIVASIRPPRPVTLPWAPGDGLRHPLATGAPAGEATVRKRAWTSYATIADAELYGAANVERLERGRPPLRFNPVAGTVEAMTVDVDDVGHARLHWPDADLSVDPFGVRA